MNFRLGMRRAGIFIGAGVGFLVFIALVGLVVVDTDLAGTDNWLRAIAIMFFVGVMLGGIVFLAIWGAFEGIGWVMEGFGSFEGKIPPESPPSSPELPE